MNVDIMKKKELVGALEESYESYENMYDENLTKMAQLHEQIEAIKEANTSIMNRQKEIAAKIRKYQE